MNIFHPVNHGYKAINQKMMKSKIQIIGCKHLELLEDVRKENLTTRFKLPG